MERQKAWLTSGAFAALCGTTKETLRHYNDIGLLPPAHHRLGDLDPHRHLHRRLLRGAHLDQGQGGAQGDQAGVHAPNRRGFGVRGAELICTAGATA